MAASAEERDPLYETRIDDLRRIPGGNLRASTQRMIACAALAAASVVVQAQKTGGSVSGQVTDPTGATVADANVVLEGIGNGHRFTVLARPRRGKGLGPSAWYPPEASSQRELAALPQILRP